MRPSTERVTLLAIFTFESVLKVPTKRVNAVVLLPLIPSVNILVSAVFVIQDLQGLVFWGLKMNECMLICRYLCVTLL